MSPEMLAAFFSAGVGAVVLALTIRGQRANGNGRRVEGLELVKAILLDQAGQRAEMKGQQDDCNRRLAEVGARLDSVEVRLADCEARNVR